MKVVILAAGLGKRFRKLGSPKPLTPLSNGFSLLAYQLHILAQYVSVDDIFVVVGYLKERIMEQFPHLTYIYNPHYATTNTATSLAYALRKVHGEDVLWLNGDVVFHPRVIASLFAEQRGSAMVVNKASVGQEEMKYCTSPEGKITAVSKNLKNPEGEALGINVCRGRDLPLLKKQLEDCDLEDFFEKALEIALQKGLVLWSVPVPSSECVEIDFPEDLERANQLLSCWN